MQENLKEWLTDHHNGKGLSHLANLDLPDIEWTCEKWCRCAFCGGFECSHQTGLDQCFNGDQDGFVCRCKKSDDPKYANFNAIIKRVIENVELLEHSPEEFCLTCSKSK